MISSPRSMLEDTLHEFERKIKDPEESWDRFIDFLGTDQNYSLFYEIGHNFDWLFEDRDFVKNIVRIYNPRTLKGDFYDHLGEMYKERFSNAKRNGGNLLYLIPMNRAFEFAKLPSNENRRRLCILDPQVKSGRLLMAAYKNSPDIRLFGVEKDIRLYRIAYINLAIHNIPATLLHADRSKHEIDIAKEDGKYNWQFANCWYSQTDKLKPVSS